MYHQINWSNFFLMQTMIISNQIFPWQYWFHVHPQINSPERSKITLVAFVQYLWKCSCTSSDCLPWELSSHTGCICWSFLGTPPCLRVLSQRFSPARTAQPWWSLEPLRHRGPFTFLSFISISSFIIGNFLFCYSCNSGQLPTIVMLVKEWSIKWKFQILKVWCHITNHHHQHPIPSARPKINAWIKLI